MKELIYGLYLGCKDEKDDIVLFMCVLAINLLMWSTTLIILVKCVDYVTGVERQDNKTVSSKEYVPEYYAPVMTGKVSTIMYFPDKYVVSFNGLDCTVSKGAFDQINVGDEMKVTYYSGITSSEYCTDVE